MNNSKDDLRNLWQKEKESYKTQEIGSGVQIFVKKILKSQEIFNLKEGKLSTPLAKRKNEFLEEKTKKQKRADIIIFVDSDRIIPVEIEKFGNINAGESQLFNYQRVWDKKYGILTDGYSWKFFNNNISLKTFSLEQILDKTDEFLDYWNEYIQLENYYLNFFKEIGQLKLFEEDISVGNNIQSFFVDITTLISSFKNKLNIKGYFDVVDESESEKRAVEITYAYIIQFILYKTLVDNNFEDFGKDFQQRFKRIYKDLKNKSYGDIITVIEAISRIISKNIYRPFIEEQEFINKKLDTIRQKPKNVLQDVTPWLDIFIFVKRYSFTNVHFDIFGYIYENYLKDLYAEKNKGQYFTHPAIVDFMLEKVGYSPQNISKRYKRSKNSISLIDPACGSGTFLYSAVRNIIDAIPNGSLSSSKKIEKLVNDDIFGLDIEEFPLYLAEMSIIMRLLPLIINEKYNNPMDKKIKVFKTKDSIAEFLDTAIINTKFDQQYMMQGEKGQLDLFGSELNLGYSSYVRDEDDLKEVKRSLEYSKNIPRRRFDFVIGNPPYISYNKCAKQKLLCIDLIKQGKSKMSNIYGYNLNTVPGRIKTYPPKPNLYAFFIAVGLSLLKDNGFISFIIPQTLLTANDLDVLRYILSNYTTMKCIYVFPQKVFVGRGIKQNKPVPTSSLIFIAQKTPPKSTNAVKIYISQDSSNEIGEIVQNVRNKKYLSSTSVLQKTLLDEVDNWNFITKSSKIQAFLREYKKRTDSFDIYRLFENSVPKFGAKFYFDVGFILNKKYISTEQKEGYFEVLDFKNFKGYSIFNATHYYPNETDKIELTRSNQGHITLEPKCKIVWRIKNHNGFKFTDRPIIFHMGTSSIICSDNYNEMLYLLSILNSRISSTILESYLKIPSEKEYLVSILPIKKYIRVPRINSSNKAIKKEIIYTTKMMLEEEQKFLREFIDFKKILIQKFDNIDFQGGNLLLISKNHKISCKMKSKSQSAIDEILSYKNDAIMKDKRITLNSLMNLRVIDKQHQQELKTYIDDLVFALYFDIKIEKLGIKHSSEIRKACKKHKYYKLTMQFVAS